MQNSLGSFISIDFTPFSFGNMSFSNNNKSSFIIQLYQQHLQQQSIQFNSMQSVCFDNGIVWYHFNIAFLQSLSSEQSFPIIMKNTSTLCFWITKSIQEISITRTLHFLFVVDECHVIDWNNHIPTLLIE